MFHVKQSISLEQFIKFIELQKIDLNAIQHQQLLQYLDLILLWSQKQNLVSKQDLEHLVERHFLPSMFLYTVLEKYNRLSVLDIGSGAGFPGIVLQIMRPDFQIFLIDSSRKKYLFLCEVLDNLNLSGKPLSGRVEIFAKHTDQVFDIVVTRAVASMQQISSWANPLIHPESQIFLIKGGDIEKEISEINQKEFTVKTIQPNPAWIKFSPNLKSKNIVIMERKNV